ncbi:zinc phosphodiesterase ELAC protein 1-like isoform X2 [Pomacea canaliculata]|nr:zinc phosphodiesterase ELAC protein 1-like isoform X2 [Pomacea canaliculata]
MKSSLKPGKVSKIFISHLHGDHLFGLPGLLCTVSQNNQRSEPVEIYGPLGLRAYLQTTLGVSHSEMGFTFTVHELVPVSQQLPPDIWEIEKTANSLPHPNEVPGKRIECNDNLVWNVFSDKGFVVQAVWVKHRVPSFAYVVKENDRPGKLDANKLKSLGVPAGPLYGKLKGGEVVHLADGTQIKPKDVMGPPQAGYIIAIGGDSSDSSELLKIACGSHVLIHEATLENAMEELCIQKGHSTPRMAGLLAKQLGVKQLILTHFSQRYKPLSCNTEPGEASVRILLQEAQEAFGSNEVICAEDLVTFCLPRLEMG